MTPSIVFVFIVPLPFRVVLFLFVPRTDSTLTEQKRPTSELENHFRDEDNITGLQNQIFMHTAPGTHAAQVHIVLR
jgi:hypothetical protein